MNYKERKVLIATYSPSKTVEETLIIDNEPPPPPKPKRINSSVNNKFQYPNYVTKNLNDLTLNVRFL
jgi:hypothetical protein